MLLKLSCSFSLHLQPVPLVKMTADEKAFFHQDSKEEGLLGKKLDWRYIYIYIYRFLFGLLRWLNMTNREVKTRHLQISVGPKFHFRNGNVIKGKKGQLMRGFYNMDTIQNAASNSNSRHQNAAAPLSYFKGYSFSYSHSFTPELLNYNHFWKELLSLGLCHTQAQITLPWFMFLSDCFII